MKKSLIITVFVICLTNILSFGQVVSSKQVDPLNSSELSSDDSSKVCFYNLLQKMNLKQVCDTLGIAYDYNLRYENIVLPLCKNGKILFDASTNPYLSGGQDTGCYVYIGTAEQNEILKRNLIVNRGLIINGKIDMKSIKKWKVVK